ncbi:MFS transporter [Pandoraea apista]|uniref:MFS transporter n=1 Tax=Pandoraea apista TaxID=93218 RepID=UPI000659DC5F|nr:MFS transporter [Pandoraea apista]RRW96563.1 MFS transporter [Pandoraea apista]RRX02103.1 MFS transporter [Pandoraea apista]CFB61889.1 Multidrug resistance protein stp [Pandoraea apista]
MDTDCTVPGNERAAPLLYDVSDAKRILNATCISYVVVLLDTSIVNVALEPLALAFDVQLTGLQWVVSAYTLMFASLLLTGGTLGDRWGAKRGYLAGLMIFMMASLGCALALSPSMLVAARALQGIGAALLVPCSLKLIHQATPDPAERARAIGRWVGLGGVALAAGPLVGGALIHWLGWRSIFFVNVPVCLVGMTMAWRIAAARRTPSSAHRVDLAGLLAGMVALATLIGVLIEGRILGWTSAWIVGGTVVSVLAWFALVHIEARHPCPMLPLPMFRSGVFTGSTAASMASAFVFYGLLFVVSLHFQQMRGYRPLETGMALLPMTAMVAVGSLLAGRLLDRFGPLWPMLWAFAAYAAGALGLAFVTANVPYAFAVLPMLAIGAASGIVSPIATAPALQTVAPSRAGVAAAVLNTARQAGAALGVAIFGSLVGVMPATEAGLRPALALAAGVSLAVVPVWRLALRRQGEAS